MPVSVTQTGARRRRRTVGALGVTVVLSGCIGDPRPDPDVAPLEVVIEGCVLNRDTVAPGTHDVSVIGAGEVTFRDESGASSLVVAGGATASLRTTEQAYAVVCQGHGQGVAPVTVRLVSAQ